MLARTPRWLIAAAALVALAGCGGASPESAPSSPSTSSASQAASFPVTVTDSVGEVRIERQPERIVSISPTLTEMLFAIGAGEQVAAVDDQSTYPDEAPRTELSGYQPNVEAIAGYRPDLVVVSEAKQGLRESLNRLDIPVVDLAAAVKLSDTYDQLSILGQVTGHPAEAGQAVIEVTQRVNAAVAKVQDAGLAAKGWKIYHELDPTFYSATSKTFLGSLYADFGLTNIADQAKGAASGYPKLSGEYVVKSAPDVIVLADTKCCGQSAATVAKRPAFADVPAVREGRVIELDDDIASRWGPRVGELAEQVAAALVE